MTRNLIVLTPGSSGSSVLTRLLSLNADYWVGEETTRVDFDTWENAELVRLNRELLAAIGYHRHDCVSLRRPDVDALIDLVDDPAWVDRARAFVETCRGHRPFLWKDPRLCYTIHFWAPFLPLDECDAIVIRREIVQKWTGTVLHRKSTIGFHEERRIDEAMRGSVHDFLTGAGRRAVELTFEDLLLRPRATLDRLNDAFDLALTLDDLKAVYRGPLHRKRYSPIDTLRALGAFAYWRFLRERNEAA